MVLNVCPHGNSLFFNGIFQRNEVSLRFRNPLDFENCRKPVSDSLGAFMRKISKQEREVLVEGYLRTKPRNQQEDKRIKKTLQYSTAEGAITSVSNSVANSYLTPFALSLGATSPEIGLLASVKNLAETTAQIPGALLTQYTSRKAIWLLSWISSRAFWIPVILLPFIFLQNSVQILILLTGIITFLASLNGPAWTSLMGDIVPENIRGRYLGRRNMIAGFSGLLATLVAGSFLSLLGFSLIFAISTAIGLFGIIFFVKMYEPPLRTVFHYKHSVTFNRKELVTSLRINKNFALFTLFIMAMNFAVHIAAPFFTVYMLKDLGITYEIFGLLIAFEALVSIICQPYWGKLNDRYGERVIIFFTAAMVCLVPFFWFFVTAPAHILLANAFSAFAWAGFDLVSFNFLIAAVPSEKRPQYIANHRFLRGVAVVGGALLGAYIVQHFETAVFLGFYGIQIIFLISFMMRAVSLVFLAGVKEPDSREHEIVPLRYVFWRAVAVEPARGFVHAVEYTFHYPYELAKLKEKIRRRIKTRKE